MGMTNRGRPSKPRTKLTSNKGASETRHAILRKMDELENDRITDRYIDIWQKLRIYIEGLAKRASKKPGGLGRK